MKKPMLGFTLLVSVERASPGFFEHSVRASSCRCCGRAAARRAAVRISMLAQGRTVDLNKVGGAKRRSRKDFVPWLL